MRSVPEADTLLQQAWEARKRARFNEAGNLETQARQVLRQAGVGVHDVAVYIMEFKEQAGRRELGLKQALVRLANTNPKGIRKHLVPLLKKAAIAERDAMRTLKQVGEVFKRKYKLDYQVDKGMDGPEVTIWDSNDEPVYAATLTIEYDAFDEAWRINIHQGRSGSGTSFDEKLSVRDLVSNAERIAKRESDLL